MSLCGIIVFCLSAFVLLIGAAEGNPSCHQESLALATCMEQNTPDYSRLEDISYRAELCRKLRTSRDCYMDARENCPALGTMDDMFSHVDSMCPEESEDNDDGDDACVDAESDLMDCLNEFMEMASQAYVSASEACEATATFLPCVEEIRDRCSNHEGIEQIYSALQPQMVMLREHCGPYWTSTSGSSSEEVDNDNDVCTLSNEIDMYTAMGRCHEPLQEAMTGQRLCAALTQAQNCLQRHLDNCQNQIWLRPSMTNEVQTIISGLGSTKRVHSC